MSGLRVSAVQALAWRARRQFLADGAASVEEVVERLGAMPAAASPEHAVGRRMREPRLGAVADAVRESRVMVAYAHRGAAQYLTPHEAGAALALRGSSRMWERPAWVSHYRLDPGDWPDLLRLVAEILTVGPFSREEFAAELDRDRRFGHLGDHVRRGGGGDALVKAMGWQGAVCFAPSRGRTTMFRSPEDLPGWRGVWDVAEAGPHVVRSYSAACGPAGYDRLQSWIGAGLGAGRGLRGWVRDQLEAGVIAEIEVDGEPMLVRAEDVDDLATIPPVDEPTVVLLPGGDLWVLGPGTDDPLVVPQAHRSRMTRGDNPALIDGVVAGTWRWPTGAAEPTITWFEEITPPPVGVVDVELRRLAHILERPSRGAI